MRRAGPHRQRLEVARAGRGRRVGRRPRPGEQAGGHAGRSAGRLGPGAAVLDPPGRGGASRQEQGGDRQANDQAIRAVRRPRCRGGRDLLVGVEPGTGIHGRLGLEEPPGGRCRGALGAPLPWAARRPGWPPPASRSWLGAPGPARPVRPGPGRRRGSRPAKPWRSRWPASGPRHGMPSAAWCLLVHAYLLCWEFPLRVRPGAGAARSPRRAGLPLAPVTVCFPFGKAAASPPGSCQRGNGHRDGPHPPAELEPSPPGASLVVLAGRATRVP